MLIDFPLNQLGEGGFIDQAFNSCPVVIHSIDLSGERKEIVAKQSNAFVLTKLTFDIA